MVQSFPENFVLASEHLKEDLEDSSGANESFVP